MRRILSNICAVFLVILGFIALTLFNLMLFESGSQLTEAEMFENLCKTMPVFSSCHQSVATFFLICGYVMFSGLWITYIVVMIWRFVNYIRERRSDK